MSATLNAFGQDQIDKARYGIQSQIYTYGPVTLNPGPTTIFNMINWNKGTDIEKVLILDSIAVSPQNSQVKIGWTHDSQQSDAAQGWTDGMPSGTLSRPMFVIAGHQLVLNVTSELTTPLNSFQLNYGVTVMSLNMFQRMLYGFPKTDQDNTDIKALLATPQNANLDVNAIFKQGNRPFSMSSVFQNLFANRRINDPNTCLPFHLTIPVGGTQSQPRTITVNNNQGSITRVFVLRGISLEGAPAGLSLTIDRDNDLSLVNQLNAAAFVQSDDSPWPFFIPAKDHFAITANGTSGTTYPICVDIDAYQASDLMLAHLDMLPNSPANQTILTKTRLGLQ